MRYFLFLVLILAACGPAPETLGQTEQAAFQSSNTILYGANDTCAPGYRCDLATFNAKFPAGTPNIEPGLSICPRFMTEPNVNDPQCLYENDPPGGSPSFPNWLQDSYDSGYLTHAPGEGHKFVFMYPLENDGEVTPSNCPLTSIYDVCVHYTDWPTSTAPNTFPTDMIYPCISYHGHMACSGVQSFGSMPWFAQHFWTCWTNDPSTGTAWPNTIHQDIDNDQVVFGLHVPPHPTMAHYIGTMWLSVTNNLECGGGTQ